MNSNENLTATQTRAVQVHARWTLRTFGMPNNIQAEKIAASLAASRGLDAGRVASAMNEVWAAAE